MCKICVSGIDVTIEKKDIKNLHLYVKPPLGEVFVSAPKNLNDESIRVFVISKISWIKKQQAKYKNQARHTKREFVSGESIFVWGRRYNLDVIYSNKENNITLRRNKFILQVRENSTIEQRENYVNEWYREQLKTAAEPLMQKWEDTIGVYANEWKTKNMHTKWGTCTVNAKRVWLNLQLTKKTPECLEYVIVHELCHLLEKNHNDRFKGYMDEYYPNWQNVKEQLNEQMLDYYEEWGNE